MSVLPMLINIFNVIIIKMATFMKIEKDNSKFHTKIKINTQNN